MSRHNRILDQHRHLKVNFREIVNRQEGNQIDN